MEFLSTTHFWKLPKSQDQFLRRAHILFPCVVMEDVTKMNSFIYSFILSPPISVHWVSLPWVYLSSTSQSIYLAPTEYKCSTSWMKFQQAKCSQAHVVCGLTIRHGSYLFLHLFISLLLYLGISTTHQVLFFKLGVQQRPKQAKFLLFWRVCVLMREIQQEIIYNCIHKIM